LDITILNLNMLYVRYFDAIERERHLPLGTLYVTAALEEAGYTVQHLDYQMHEADDPFSSAEILKYVGEPAPIVGFSCMANLLPFTLMAMKDFKEAWPDRTLLLAGVGPKSVEHLILERFPWVDIVVRGESERTAPLLLDAIKGDGDLSGVPGISYRRGGKVVHNPRPERITDLDALHAPAYHHINLRNYSGFGMITSRGCPYPCTFCSVAPIWDLKSYFRSPESIVAEIKRLHDEGGAELILFQDEFFVSGRDRVLRFCDALAKSGLNIKWKAFGRVNLTDNDMMVAMEETGCVEIRFGIESGSDKILEITRKGFTTDQAVDVVSRACEIFRRVDAFYVWGYPFETMEDFYQSVFQMVSFRMMGARVLPSLLCLLPQTEIYKQYVNPSELEFAPDLLPEYMVTGHEVSRHAHMEIRPEHASVFEFIRSHPDIFPGFFHLGLETRIRPRLRVLQEFGFYPASEEELAQMESCGGHSPNIGDRRNEIATRAES